MLIVPDEMLLAFVASVEQEVAPLVKDAHDREPTEAAPQVLSPRKTFDPFAVPEPSRAVLIVPVERLAAFVASTEQEVAASVKSEQATGATVIAAPVEVCFNTFDDPPVALKSAPKPPLDSLVIC